MVCTQNGLEEMTGNDMIIVIMRYLVLLDEKKRRKCRKERRRKIDKEWGLSEIILIKTQLCG